MGIVDRILGREVAQEQRAIAPWWPSESTSKTAGVHINEENATSIGALYAAVKLYADTVASLPWDTYIRVDGERRVYRPRPRWMDFPEPNNPNLTSFDFKHRVVSSLLLDGNAFILCLRDSSDDVIETRVLDPQKVEILSGEKGEPIYKVTTKDGASTLGADSIVHIPLFATGENLRGLNPIEHHRVTLGLASASQLFGAKFYEQGATVGGVVKVPGELTAEQAQNLRDGFSRRHEGVDRAWRVAVLTGGADYQQQTVKIADLQLVETLHYGVEAIARIYGVPLHLLQYPGGNTSYSSVEVISIEWLRLGLGPLVARIEAAFQRLVPGAERTFLKFTLDGLLRATTQERYNSYATALNNGFLSVNEVRALEDRSSIGAAGDEYWKPLNIGVVGQEPQP
ncbi:COG4695 Phage-related protein [uncultured Caudovirales phage]|uniref:COG4695 Phage-related protein n=1 Tax=uncultured Caudovirales phage TaxID=2100421 RepID=A0A6J5R3I2_9CAUD|nr:COG4695 Phage-related protein [uncultured Caudovirales phage]